MRAYTNITARRRSIDPVGNEISKKPSVIQSTILRLLCRRNRSLNIAVIGAVSSGKTSVVRRYAGDLFYEEKCDPLSNSFRTGMLVEKHNVIKVFDVTVNECHRVAQYDVRYCKDIKSADAFILMYSMNDFESVLEISKILTDLYKVNKSRCPLVVIGNKTDICKTTANDITDFERHLEFSGHRCFRVSAKWNENILDAFEELTSLYVDYCRNDSFRRSKYKHSV